MPYNNIWVNYQNFPYIGNIFLGGFYWIIFNNRFHSFLVRIMIQKDNIDDKISETTFL